MKTLYLYNTIIDTVLNRCISSCYYTIRQLTMAIVDFKVKLIYHVKKGDNS